MASTPTVRKQPIKIRLTYNKGKVTSRPRSPMTFQKGDVIEFVSRKDIKVYVNLNSAAYNPRVFTPDSGTVEVMANPSGKARSVQCGFVQTVKGKEVGYGWLPDDVRSGLSGPQPKYETATGVDMDP